MNISRRSWHYWVYYHTYEYDPKDGCTYLWKLIWACLWFIPLTLLFLPNLLVEAIRSIYNRRKFDYPVYVNEITIAFWQLITTLFLTCMCILMWYHIPPVVIDCPGANWHIFFLLGFVGWSLVCMVGVCLGLLYSIQVIVNWIKGGARKPTLLSIYIKAFKEKHCPKINIVD